MVFYMFSLLLLFIKAEAGNVGLSMEEIHLPQTMHKVFQSNQKTKISANVFNSPENGELTDVVIRRSRGKNGDLIIQAFQGNLDNTIHNQKEIFGHNPFKDENLMKRSFRNLKGSASFLEGDDDDSDFVDDRERIELIGEFPWTAIGYLELIECLNGFCAQISACTATLVSQTIAITAAHCVYDLTNDTDGKAFGFYDDYFYYPGRSGDEMPLGKFDIADAIVSGKWGKGQKDFDYAILLLEPNQDGDTAGGLAGWLGVTVDCSEVEQFQLNLAGYPKDLSDNGDVMYYTFCDDVFLDACSSVTRLFEYQCTTARGMSGAPLWVYKKDVDGSRQVRGIHSRGLPDKSQGIFIDQTIFNMIQQEINASYEYLSKING